jgi:hypothetical protein
MRRLSAVVVFAVAACSAPEPGSDLPFYRTADLTPEWLSADEAGAPNMHRVGDFASTSPISSTRPVPRSAPP